MILGENINSVYSKGKEIQRVFSYGKLVWEKEMIDYSTTAFTIQALDNASVMVQGSYQKPNVLNFKYSINGGDWNQLDTKSTININKDDTISIIGTDIYVIKITGLSDIYGNIMSLKFGDDFVGQTTLQDSMFINFSNSDIRKADKLILPATTLGFECYSYMFDGCRSLITAPELPATTLASYCYADMFRNCTSLTTAPELPATTLSYRCYYGMFRGCSSLNYIKCYAYKTQSNTSFGECLSNWTTGVSSEGTFVCLKNYADKLKPYIPSTWTIEYI